MMISRYYQQGSALIEASLILLVMIPLVFGLVSLGNLIDLKQTTVQASRYSAWESTVYPSAPDNMNLQTKERFFSHTQSPISSQLSENDPHELWGKSMATQQNDPLESQSNWRVLVEKSDIDVTQHSNQSSQGVALRVGQTLAASGNILDGLKGNEWGLTGDGLLRSSVAVEVDGSSWLLSEEGTCSDSNAHCLSVDNAIVLDDWMASGAIQAKRRVRSLMPASALQPLGDAVSLVGKLPLFGELKDLKGAFGYVDLTVLPEYAKP